MSAGDCASSVSTDASTTVSSARIFFMWIAFGVSILVVEARPQIPGGDGTIRTPSLGNGVQPFDVRRLPKVVGFPDRFHDTKISGGKHIRPGEAENQEHFDGPAPNSLDFREFL